MSRRGGGIFAIPIMLVVLVLLIFIWVVLVQSAVSPTISNTLTQIQGTGGYADETEFVLRMLPWGVGVIIVIGVIWMAMTQ